MPLRLTFAFYIQSEFQRSNLLSWWFVQYLTLNFLYYPNTAMTKMVFIILAKCELQLVSLFIVSVEISAVPWIVKDSLNNSIQNNLVTWINDVSGLLLQCRFNNKVGIKMLTIVNWIIRAKEWGSNKVGDRDKIPIRLQLEAGEWFFTWRGFFLAVGSWWCNAKLNCGWKPAVEKAFMKSRIRRDGEEENKRKKGGKTLALETQ